MGVTARPGTVTLAAALWFVALVAWDLSALLVALDLPDASDLGRGVGSLPYMSPQDAAAVGEQRRAALRTAAVWSLVLSILVTVVLAWVGVQMRGGARWARIAVTVFAFVGVVDLVAQLFSNVPSGLAVVVALLDVVSLAAMVATVVLMFRSVSERWFRTALDVI